MRFRALVLAAVSALGLAAPAAAQRVDRIVAFGDSYADDGNFFELTGVARPAIYANGRFSDGTNFVDTMGQILSVPIDNFAIGGAFTGPGNTTFFNINGGPTPAGRAVPGFPQEVASFLAGGGPAAFPRVSGQFDADDLVVVSIGGNDARFFRLNGGTVAAAPAAAAISVGEATAGLNSLVNAGARNITYLAGDVGRLPEAIGTPSAPAGTAFSSAFNAGMQTTLAGYANQGVIVNYLDLNKVGDVVAANLSEFGLISAGACPVSCVTTNTEQLRQYLFYVDRVHLTSRGFEIVGQYAVRQLEAPLHFDAQTESGLSAAAGFGQLLSGRLDLADPDAERPLSFWLVATGASQGGGGGDESLAFDHDSVGVAGGLEYAWGSGVLGAALSYSTPKADFTNANGRVRSRAYQGGLYASFESGGLFAQGYAGYGQIDTRIRRRAVIDDIRAETEGDMIVAGGEAGYLFELGRFRAGPLAGAQYSRVKLDAFTEEGDPVLTLNVGRQRASQTLGFAGFEVRTETETAGLAVAPYFKLLAEKELDASRSDTLYALTAAPGIVNRFTFGEADDDVYGRVEGGATFDLTGPLSLQVQGSATLDHPQHNEFTGFVGLKARF